MKPFDRALFSIPYLFFSLKSSFSDMILVLTDYLLPVML